tara:strand:- start:233 stop:436 length:204 start_codon:yes stop_codon:yes gene_type:complete
MAKDKAVLVSREMTYEQYRKFCNTEHGINSYMVEYLQGDKAHKNTFKVSVFEEDENKFNDLILALNL